MSTLEKEKSVFFSQKMKFNPRTKRGEMKWFFYIVILFSLIAALAVGGRGTLFEKEPVQVFSDMVEQDRLGALAEDIFFVNSQGARPLPVKTVAQGLSGSFYLEAKEESKEEGLAFSQKEGSYEESGKQGNALGTGLPESYRTWQKEQPEAFLKAAKAQYEAHCAVCHGVEGKGDGPVGLYPGFPALVPFSDPLFQGTSYPDGRLFAVISVGQGNMKGYGAILPLKSRWLIIAYVRALQEGEKKGTLKEGSF